MHMGFSSQWICRFIHTLDMQITLGTTAILTLLSLLIYEHRVSFHSFTSSLIAPIWLNLFLNILFFLMLLKIEFFQFLIWIVHCQCLEIQLNLLALIVFFCVCVCILYFPYTIMSSAKRDSFTCFFPIWMSLISFFLTYCSSCNLQDNVSYTILNRSSESRHCCCS